MSNQLKFRAALAAMAGVALFSVGASAQVATNGPLLAAPAGGVSLVEKASEADIRGFLEPLGIVVAPFEEGDETAYTMTATTESGGQFLVTLFTCEDPTNGVNCEGLTSYAGFSNAGLAYDDINQFNTTSTVSKAVNLETQRAVVFGVQQYLFGGVSADNMQHVIVLFLNDLDDFMQSRANNATTIAHQASDGENTNSKTSNALDAPPVSAPGAFGPISLNGAIASAITNTHGVSFGVAVQR